LMNKADNILISGGMAFTFVKAMGGNIGKSLCEDDRLQTAKDILQKAKEIGVTFYIPTDAIIADNFSNDANFTESKIREIPDGWMGLDAGPETIKMNADVIKNSKTILWNGPMAYLK
jgi:phosphoglycerate kinase